MVDARNTFRKVTRKIYDFSPEQTQNLTAIIWLYRGQQDRFLKLVNRYLQSTLDSAQNVFDPISRFFKTYDTLAEIVADLGNESKQKYKLLKSDVGEFSATVTVRVETWTNTTLDNTGLQIGAEQLAPMVETSRDLTKQIDQVFKLTEKQVKNQKVRGRGLNRLTKDADEARKAAIEALRQVRYFHKQARWLQERFPDAKLRDIEGLVKLVSHADLEENDWSLTPGRYVGVVPEEDEDFDFEEALRDIHLDLASLNEEAAELAANIHKRFEELGI